MQNVDSGQSAARHCTAAKILKHKVALSATLCFKSQVGDLLHSLGDDQCEVKTLLDSITQMSSSV